ncbi:MAG: heme NO-binding domain-containing protein [Deltaproteobacteria bacterium]|jgi:hypothetical protein|nr:heme NO-binding domain-containing protein [Deltaproteobacteria bacterium]
MRGFVFTEFVEVVEESYGLDVADQMIAATESICDGAYVAVDVYPAEEFVGLVTSLSRIVDSEVATLVESYGEHLFPRLAHLYSHLLVGLEDPFDFLEKLDGHIHFEVQKLEPEAELPNFDFERRGPDEATLIYASHRALPHFAAGLLKGCFRHFGSGLEIRSTDRSDGAGTLVEFEIRRKVEL